MFAEHVMAMLERDQRVMVLTAAMLEGTGLAKVQERFPERCLDVGMAEQHAVSLAAGLALAGYRPICAIYSTFLQRAYDQVFQEIALQRAPVLFCLDRGGLVGADGATHNGVFDIAYLRCLPHFTLMAPRDTGELALMMELASTCDGPVAIRFPRGAGARPDEQLPCQPFALGEAELVAEGNDGCLVAYGPITYTALEVRRRILQTTGRTLAVVNGRFAKPLDERLIVAELRRQPVVFTLEDHMASGGFGSAVVELALAHRDSQLDANRLEILGLPDDFVDHGERTEQLAAAGLDVDTLTERVRSRLEALAPPMRRVRLMTGG
jgi:1-deoxy-D-xylulose-5-phosphate synthase